MIGERPPEQPRERYVRRPAGIEVEVVLAGLEAPTAIAFPPDGRLLIAERPGRIRVRMPRSRLVEERPWALLPEGTRGAGILKDLALDPAFPSRPWVYVLYEVGDGAGRRMHRVSRLRDRGFAGDRETVLIDGLPAGTDPDAGRLLFGPGGHLYVGLGEPVDPADARDPEIPAGKVLRFTVDGAVPEDNPFGALPAWTLGHQGIRGLARNPVAGGLLVVETGGGVSGRDLRGDRARTGSVDELNAMTAGDDAGWPAAVAWADLEETVDPVAVWTDPSTSPAGAVLASARAGPSLGGDLFVATLAAEALLRIRFGTSASGDLRPLAIERWFVSGPGTAGAYGRLRDVAEGPDGGLWLLTSNRDGRGRVQRGDDKVLRIVPVR